MYLYAELWSQVGQAECQRHRLMLAVENSQCVDWLSQNLIQALKCGAIPILYQIGGLPDYRSLYGIFPHINASQPGWHQRVQAVMRNDSYYKALLREAAGGHGGGWGGDRSPAHRRPSSTTHTRMERPSDDIAQEHSWFHCAWWQLHAARPSAAARYSADGRLPSVQWQPCAFCEGDPSGGALGTHTKCAHQQQGYTSFRPPGGIAEAHVEVQAAAGRAVERHGRESRRAVNGTWAVDGTWGGVGRTGGRGERRAPPPPPLVDVGPAQGMGRTPNSLGMCEGNCDTDLDCAGDLFCFQRIGTSPVPGCAADKGLPGSDYCTEIKHVLQQPPEPWYQGILFA